MARGPPPAERRASAWYHAPREGAPINYIGSKFSLLDEIRGMLRKHGATRGTFCDVFSGTGIVAQMARLDGFTVVDCETCGGLLKPDVVYFGENVPPARVAAANDLVDSARALLVLGTSLHVFSGRRHVVRAAKAGTPVAVVNQGPTRADEIATILLDAPLGAALAQVVRTIEPEPSAARPA